MMPKTSRTNNLIVLNNLNLFFSNKDFQLFLKFTTSHAGCINFSLTWVSCTSQVTMHLMYVFFSLISLQHELRICNFVPLNMTFGFKASNIMRIGYKEEVGHSSSNTTKLLFSWISVEPVSLDSFFLDAD